MTPAQRAGEVPNERTAATIAWTQVWRQRTPRGLLRAGRPMAHAQKRQGGWVRTRTQAGAWQQPIARASMPPFGVLERCVGRLRSPPSLAARAALQWRPPPDGGARRRAESKAIAVEFGASCTCCARPVSAPGQCPARSRAGSDGPPPSDSLRIVRSARFARSTYRANIRNPEDGHCAPDCGRQRACRRSGSSVAAA